ncbi:protein ACCELERATED CELL DEATH 6-like [Papaver somniferum]|uniref:protein ACCELERATED CELL DEATH 6-like n=1 Tax=Papaver somniferum TaxID=3469 RepID=UPI000E6FEE72|nr:protein ACCELERATED CELL DEATH 6-like [Papaver somniferum]
MFVEELLKIMPPEALESKDNVQGNTALHIAAREGNKNVSKAIVDKNRNATQIRDKDQKVPLLTAALFASPGQKDTIEYLCTVTENKDPSPFAGPDGASLICNILDAHYYDIALYLFQRYPNLVLEKTKNSRMWPLEVISERPFAFRSENKLKLRERCIYSLIQIDTTSLGRYHGSTMGDVENPSVWSQDVHMRYRGIISKFFSRFITHFAPHVPSMERIYKLKLMHEQAAALVKGLICHLRITKSTTEISDFFKNSQVLQTAIKFGTNELVEECLTHFPDLNWANMNNKRLIQIAIEERNEKILKLICKTSKEYKKQLFSNRDLSGNSILHYAAKLAPLPQLTSVSGAALQMQREMQWFKGVQNLVDERNRHVRNKDGKSAQFIFTQEHNELRKEGEQWMKDTSQSCMLVATLIATVVFAAAFTVPGGNLSNDNNEYKAGTPIFLYVNSFMVFAVADSLALFSSTTSILMFLAILTSRYAEEDFLTSLPKKLIIGLGTLFFSIATTMIAFGAALFIVLGSRFTWVPIPIALCACLPVSLFALLQFPLFVVMVRSTYCPSIFRFD